MIIKMFLEYEKCDQCINIPNVMIAQKITMRYEEYDKYTNKCNQKY